LETSSAYPGFTQAFFFFSLSRRDGSAIHDSDAPAAVDDPAVAKLRALGAVVLGVTTMTEGGVTPLGYAVAAQGPFNAFDAARYSGGSSGGSAVAVALGLCPMALGFDGGGSIRIPAAFAGAVGLATTFGRLDSGKISSTMVKGGPIAATASDAALYFAAMGSAGPDSFYGKVPDLIRHRCGHCRQRHTSTPARAARCS